MRALQEGRQRCYPSQQKLAGWVERALRKTTIRTIWERAAMTGSAEGACRRAAGAPLSLRLSHPISQLRRCCCV